MASPSKGGDTSRGQRLHTPSIMEEVASGRKVACHFCGYTTMVPAGFCGEGPSSPIEELYVCNKTDGIATAVSSCCEGGGKSGGVEQDVYRLPQDLTEDRARIDDVEADEMHMDI